jgi:UDP-N-acetylglucosamine acyltransferase
LTNSIHPTAFIGPDVVLGDNNTIGPFAVLQGPLRVGDGNWIGAGVVLGAYPEVRSLFDSEKSTLTPQQGLVIGSNNVIREYAQIHQGWKHESRLGDDAYIMNQVYIAHDCSVGDGVTLASSVLVAGHVSIGRNANIGMGATIHQGLTIGSGAMIGMGAVVVKNVPLFSKTFGNPSRPQGINVVGMQRLGCDEDDIRLVETYLADPDNKDLLTQIGKSPTLSIFL